MVAVKLESVGCPDHRGEALAEAALIEFHEKISRQEQIADGLQLETSLAAALKVSPRQNKDNVPSGGFSLLILRTKQVKFGKLMRATKLRQIATTKQWHAFGL